MSLNLETHILSKSYVDTSEGYEGSGEIMSKFGIESQDDLTLIISRERYEEYIKPLIENKSNIKLSSRPKEGDLIFFPLGNRLFEIKFVEHEKPFYQLKKNYVYELRCELFRIGDEVIDTDVDAIDNALLGSDASLGATDLLHLVSVPIYLEQEFTQCLVLDLQHQHKRQSLMVV